MEKLNILVELRPALDGYAGIPQECRLLFSGLASHQANVVEGLIQSSMEFLPCTPAKNDLSVADHVRIDAYSRVIVALEKTSGTFKLTDYLRRRWVAFKLILRSRSSASNKIIQTSRFNPVGFEDFLWRKLFAKTLPAHAFQNVTSRQMQVLGIPWGVLHMCGLWSKRLFGSAKYPKLSLIGTDVFIAQTPFPGELNSATQLVVRYHDTVPVFLPHTIGNMAKHQANHYEALKANVAAGAYFACVSEATRMSLLQIFPELEERAITIENMVSHHFYLEEAAPKHVGQILASRLNPMVSVQTNSEKQADRCPDYLLMVSTIEPRKHHEMLLDAWECLRNQYGLDVKLVLVGNVGWGAQAVLERMKPWLAYGNLILLSGVPADELRILYRNAALTVCPSVAEGFDYSGVEAMCSGSVVLASDIPVHKEIYGEAADYFKTYDVHDLVDKLRLLLSHEQLQLEKKSTLRQMGQVISKEYQPASILPKWNVFLDKVRHRNSDKLSQAIK
jgi:glycosyltransferase involved in cell wall biosynthesis